MKGNVWLDSLAQPLYDTARISFAGVSTGPAINLFLAPIGAAHGIHGTKTKLETNMYLPGQLPAGNQHVVSRIEAEVFPIDDDYDPVVARADRQRIIAAGYLELLIGSKEYSTLPLVLAARRMRRSWGALLADGQDPALRDALSMLDRLASRPGITALMLDRFADFVSELFLGPPGFALVGEDGKSLSLTLAEGQNFAVRALFPNPPVVKTALAIRVLLHGLSVRTPQ